MAKDINYSHVKHKVVEPEVVSSVNDITIVNESDYGKLSVVMPTDSNNNAIYVGGEHVASGYGFDSLSVKQSVIDLIANENIQKIARGENSQQQSNPTPDNSGITEIVETIDDSEIFYNGEKIKIENGKLGKELFANDHTWIEIFNVKVNIKKNDREIINITSLDYKTFSIFDKIEITSVQFDYIVNKDNLLSNIYYTIDQTNSTYSKSLLEDTSIRYANGEKKSIKFDNLNKLIDSNRDNDVKTINLFFADFNTNDNINNKIYIPICNFKFIYPIFGIYGDENFESNSITYDTEFFNSGINANENNEYLIELGSNNEYVYHYFLIPNKYSINNISIILKSSNIGCRFELKNLQIIDSKYDTNISKNYNFYKLHQSYTGKLYWIIKIW